MATVVSITNPITGAVEQVDKLDHTAQQIDDAVALAPQLSNPNLLDNWYFRNPINQRQGRIVKPNTTYYSDNQLTTSAGTTSAYVKAYRYATGTTNGVNYASFKLEDSDTAPTYYAAPENVVRGYTDPGYGIDRWKSDENVTTTVTDGGIRIEHSADSSYRYFGQNLPPEIIPSLAGKKVTWSILVGKINTGAARAYVYVGSSTLGMINTLVAGINTITFTMPNTLTASTAVQVRIQLMGVASIDVVAAKLELGSQQTLAHQGENGNWVLNEIPDYGEQLRRCQYYSRFFGYDIEIPCSNNTDGKYIEGTLPLTMRSGNGSISYSAGFLFFGDKSFYTVSGANVSSNGGRVKIGANVSGQLQSNLQATLYLRNCSILFDL